MFGFASPRRLRELGVIGMNKRNFVYIARHNKRHLYPTVDNKLITKKLCREHGIAVTELLGVVKLQRHLRELVEFLSGMNQFVIKPARGSGGKGIVVIVGREGGDYVKPSGERVTEHWLINHVSNILSGLYSLGGDPDIALIEALVEFSDDFEGFSYEGVPDVRVIVFRGYPVMSMTRLSTHASDGRANLHQGAVGVGIDIASGRALRGVQFSRPITHHPDTGRELASLHVPDWQTMLHLAARSYEVTGLGYIGVDLVIDKSRGPLILELNARPGLAIQLANGFGLEPRLKRIKAELDSGVKRDFRERVAFVQEHFR